MKKTLRFSLLSMLMMLCGNLFADEVKFDFSTDNAYSLFGFTGFSSGDDNFGDFNEDGSTKSGDVTITVSPSGGKNANRMWKGSLRMYGGTLTVASAGKNITAITFELNNSKWGSGNTANTGTLETGKWTGNAASVVISVSANTQIKTMTVTLGEGGDTPTPDPDPQPGEVKVVTIADFNAAAESNDVWYQLSGTVKNLKDGDQYGNFDLEDETGSVYVYGLLSEKGGAKKLFQELAAEKGIKNGTKITLIGNRGSYKDKIEVTNAYFVSVDGQGDEPEPQPEEIKDATIAEFNAAEVSTNIWYKLKGEVKNLKDGDQYGNFDLEDATGSVYVYGLLSEKGGAKKLFQELAAEKGIKNGCTITIIGNRGEYSGKIEVVNAYFVSIDEPAPAELIISGEAEFTGSTTVTITPSDIDHDVYYTLDGSDPSDVSKATRYMEPFTITETCTVRAWEEDANLFAEMAFTKIEAQTISVEDVIAAAPENSNAEEGQQKVWVKGYIVGFVNGQALATGATFSAEGCEVKTNLLLATDPAETNVENCIPVQLPSGNIRNDLNLQDHADNYGKEVLLYGYVLKYFGVPGLKNVTDYEFTGNTSVSNITVENAADGKMYNVAGQRVNDSYKGIVIMNGKKIMMK